MGEERLEQFVSFLKADPGFARLLAAMREKYRSFGEVKGILVLKKASLAEKNALSGMLGVDYSDTNEIRVSVSRILKALEMTPFSGISLEEAVTAYFSEDILTKKEERTLEKELEDAFFQDLINEFSGTISSSWLQSAWQRELGEWQYLHRHYREDGARLKKALKIAMEAGNNLPSTKNEKVQIPFFAERYSRDPHTFDYGHLESNILLYIIAFYLETARFEKGRTSLIRDLELYSKVGLGRDDILNNTTVYGLSCIQKGGHEHAGCRGYLEEKEPQVLTLRLILQTKSIIVPRKRVYVVENSGVFAELVNHLSSSNQALMCTNGQFTTASWILLEKFIQQGIEVFYAGDFDPEGLQIADRLLERLPEVHLWRMSVEDYLASAPAVPLDKKRLQKLRAIKNKSLKDVCQEMRKREMAGYQEALWDRYVEDLMQQGDPETGDSQSINQF
ncbi:TIGR02679 family protein [Lachnospiraceae bacterium OttesenSCG-928-J05]|nr:TIGR02679 family protein [Lachnospiraceae bacterium OttesenSCG-928-J05]